MRIASAISSVTPKVTYSGPAFEQLKERVSDVVTTVASVPIDVTTSVAEHIASPEHNDQVSYLRRAAKLYTTGESVLNDFVIGATELAKSKMGPVTEVLGKAKSYALKSGLAIVGPLGLAALAGFLGVEGGKEIKEGIAERDAEKALGGGRTLFLGAEAAALAGNTAADIIPTVASKTVGAATKALFLPLAIAHIGIDAAQGAVKTVNGVKNKDGHKLVDGVTDLGMAVCWSVGLMAGPAIALPAAATLFGIKLVNDYKQKKAAEKQAESSPWEMTSYEFSFEAKPGRVTKPEYSPKVIFMMD